MATKKNTLNNGSAVEGVRVATTADLSGRKAVAVDPEIKASNLRTAAPHRRTGARTCSAWWRRIATAPTF